MSGAGLIYLLGRPLSAAAAFFLAGVFIDLDHIVEYTYAFGLRNFNLRKFFDAAYNHRYPRYFLFFHSYELSLLLWLAALFMFPYSWGWALALGYTVHLTADNLFNPVHNLTYFLSFRLKHRFHPATLFSEEKLNNASPWRRKLAPGGEI